MVKKVGNLIPNTFFITKGSGESDLEKHAGSYHMALYDAGISDFNIMTYSSVIPATAHLATMDELDLPPFGSEMKTIMAVSHGYQDEFVSAGVVYAWMYKDENFDGKDIRNGIVAIISIKHPDPQFEGQTKTKLGNTDAKTAVDEVFSAEVQHYLDKNVDILKKILDNSMKSYNARKAGDKARTAALKQLNDVDTKSKLAACTSKKPEECEIYIVEGDSAGGTVKTARNRKTQAVLPLRGKILNVEKATLEKILVNNEIKSMIAAFGCGIGEEFDISKLRYDKIIILTDADVDGAHISTLLLTFFYRFMPELIYSGKVYRGLPPLYKVDYEKAGSGKAGASAKTPADAKPKKRGKKKYSEYVFNDFELEKFRKIKENKIIGIQRYKGLGEMDAEQLWETTLDPESRILAQVTISDTVEADDITTTLMSSNVPPRREFIMEEAKYATLDI